MAMVLSGIAPCTCRAEDEFRLPLSGTGIERIKQSIRLKLVSPDSQTFVLERERIGSAWQVMDSTLVLRVGEGSPLSGPPARVLGQTGTYRTIGAVLGWTAGFVVGALYLQAAPDDLAARSRAVLVTVSVPWAGLIAGALIGKRIPLYEAVYRAEEES
ncbi:MAG: hypothetical protein GF346_08430 [Candidatus Eisenbacteria bacterium]|nr:hypothetical protein [Candidatus Latescibacterota bacterium]MBD3302460.1 hypothetical protein [Candidatus Eisenbacteria bacterium]